MKKILLFLFIYVLLLNTTFWFTFSQKNEIKNFVNSISTVEKKLQLLEKLKTKFVKIQDINYINTLILNLKIDNLKFRTLFLEKNLIQKLQEKNLSCESNSASLFATYILQKDIKESEIFDKLPKNTSKIQRIWWKYIWWDPYIEYVWNVNWGQSKRISKFSWYWVYANPISQVLNDLWVKNTIKYFNSKDIISSLFANKPVMFWYLQNNDWWFMDNNPIVWNTKDNKKITWYIGQHTWIIVWVSFFTNKSINKIYFYEWLSSEIQIVDYQDILKRAKYFDMMIVGN